MTLFAAEGVKLDDVERYMLYFAGPAQVGVAALQFKFSEQLAPPGFDTDASPANVGARVHAPVAVASVQADCADSQTLEGSVPEIL